MPGKILIVEDNATNLELMAYLLTRFGHSVTGAGNAEAGLEAARKSRFALILADILMPGMDGFEFLRRFKSDASARDTPVIAVTALAMVGDRDRILSAGFDGYIAKPIEPASFVDEVDRFLPAEMRSADATAHDQPSRDVEPATPSGHVVLVVDDIPANISVVRAVLEPAGHRIVAANSVENAVKIAATTRPDLIISDVAMPGASGFDLILEMQSNEALRHVPFIFLSSTYWHDVDQARGIALGAVRFLVRPIDPSALLAEVNAILRSRADG
jgi:two-component system cell cycle response regulator